MNREDRRGPREDEQPHDQPEMANASIARQTRQRLSPWADPVVALAITPLIVWEGKEAIRAGHVDVGDISAD